MYQILKNTFESIKTFVNIFFSFPMLPLTNIIASGASFLPTRKFASPLNFVSFEQKQF